MLGLIVIPHLICLPADRCGIQEISKIIRLILDSRLRGNDRQEGYRQVVAFNNRRIENGGGSPKSACRRGTRKELVMTTSVVTDEQLGQLARRQHELFRRVKEGTLSVEPVLDGLQRLIEGAAFEGRSWKVWKTIRIGGKSEDELIADIEAGGFKVDDLTRDVMAREAFTTASEPREIDLMVLSVRDLGFPKGATTREIWSQAKSHGLELCPAEVGPCLRLAYADQPNYECLLVAMEQIAVSDGSPGVFVVEHDVGGRWLFVIDARPEYEWIPGRRIVFVLPRK